MINKHERINHMNILKHKDENRYLKNHLYTRFNACRVYSSNNCSIAYITRKYKISKSSLMHWMKRFDGTIDSLRSKSKKPLTPYPNSHTDDEINNINNLMKRHPNIGLF